MANVALCAVREAIAGVERQYCRRGLDERPWVEESVTDVVGPQRLAVEDVARC